MGFVLAKVQLRNLEQVGGLLGRQGKPPSCRLQIADAGIRRRLRFVDRAGGGEPQADVVEGERQLREGNKEIVCVSEKN